MHTREVSFRNAMLLVLLLPLLPLLLLCHRGPVDSDTTRATGQSTRRRGGLQLGLLLQASSVSIPGELLLRTLLLLLLLLRGFLMLSVLCIFRLLEVLMLLMQAGLLRLHHAVLEG